jgi:hypothetical protein
MSNIKVARLLINKGVDVIQMIKIKRNDEKVSGTLLMKACLMEDVDIEFIRLCMGASGVNLNIKDSQGSTLLDYVDAAIKEGDEGEDLNELKKLCGELEARNAQRGVKLS